MYHVLSLSTLCSVVFCCAPNCCVPTKSFSSARQNLIDCSPNVFNKNLIKVGSLNVNIAGEVPKKIGKNSAEQMKRTGEETKKVEPNPPI